MAGFFSEVTAKLGVDISAFKQGMTQATAVAGKAAGEIGKKFEAKDLGRTLATALGVSLQNIADKLVEPFRESAEAAERIAQYSEEAANATERLLAARRSDLQQLEVMEKRLKKLLSENPNGEQGAGFFESLIKQASSIGIFSKMLAPLVDKSDERAAEAIAKRNRDAAILNEQIEAKRSTIAKKNYDDEVKRLMEIKDAKERDAKAAELLARFDTEQRRSKLTDDQLIVELSKEKKDVDKAIADYTKFQKEGGELTADGARELLSLKEQQLGLEKTIAEITERKAKGEAMIGTEVESNIAKWKEFRGIINSTGRGDTQLSDRELERKVSQLRADLAIREANVAQGGFDFLLNPQRNNLAQAQAELSFRNRIRREAAFFGEDRVFRNNPGLSEQRLRDILGGTPTGDQAALRKTADGIEKLTRLFESGQARTATVVVNNGG